MTKLENKTALVTGASRGIGRAIASALAQTGAHVLVHYGRSEQEARSLVASIQTNGGSAAAISADLGTPDGAAQLAKQVRSIVGDRLDVLVCNAGISKAAPIADYTVEDFDNLFATNVRGPFFLVQQLLPVLAEGSNIIVVSSVVARTAWVSHDWKTLRFLLTQPPKAHWRLWSGTGPLFSARAAYG
jgi:3-oxoacyl-[acyl-carrier protein] reductase